MLSFDDHPSDEQLSAFLAGRLTDLEIDAVNSHIQYCTDCLEKLDCIPRSKLDELIFSHRFLLKENRRPLLGLDDRRDLAEAIREYLSESQSEYTDLKLHRTGGMGFILQCSTKTKGRNASNCVRRALKVFSPDYAELMNPDINTSSLRMRFRREYEALKDVVHPHVVRVFKHVHIRTVDIELIEMEWLQGQSLYETASATPISEGNAILWTKDLLSALSFVHRLGVLHRDVSPSNCFILTSGRLCLIDFGLALRADLGDLTRLSQGGFLGTFRFASPEQKVKPSDVLPRDDIFSAGMTIGWALTGPDARGHDGVPDYVLRRLNPRFDRFIRKLIADKSERFQTADDAIKSFPLIKPKRRFHQKVAVCAALLTIGGALSLVASKAGMPPVRKEVGHPKVDSSAIDARKQEVVVALKSLESEAEVINTRFRVDEPNGVVEISFYPRGGQGHVSVRIVGTANSEHQLLWITEQANEPPTVMIARRAMTWVKGWHQVEVIIQGNEMDVFLDRRRILYDRNIPVAAGPGKAEIRFLNGQFEFVETGAKS